MQVASEMGAHPERVLMFNSLSKRSNLAGLRSGFVAGGPESMTRIKQLRNYAGAPLSLPLQRVAERIWADEAHVEHNRALYVEKYQINSLIIDNLNRFKCIFTFHFKIQERDLFNKVFEQILG